MSQKHHLKIFVWRLPLAIIGGLFSSLAMPRENIWPLIFVSVALMVVAVRGLRFFAALGVGYAAGLSFYLSQIEWMSLYLGPVPWIALSVLEAAIFAVGMALISMVWAWLERGTNGLLQSTLISLAVATIWTAREWFAINIPYGGFPWSRVAQALSDSFLSQLVFFVGISGLTFVSVFMAMSLLQVVESGLNQLRKHALSMGVVASLLVLAA